MAHSSILDPVLSITVRQSVVARVARRGRRLCMLGAVVVLRVPNLTQEVIR